MPNSVSKGFDTAMKTGSSRRLKQYPTAYMLTFLYCGFCLSWCILIRMKPNPNPNEHARMSFPKNICGQLKNKDARSFDITKKPFHTDKNIRLLKIL